MQLNAQIGGIISIVMGVVSGLHLVRSLIRHHASKGWPVATGKILESGLDEDSDGFAPRVLYVYSVRGGHYTNGRLYFHTCNRSSEQNARRHLSAYPVGKSVPVRYNPRKPQDALLDNHLPFWLPLFWLFFAAFMLAAGAGSLLDGWLDYE